MNSNVMHNQLHYKHTTFNININKKKKSQEKLDEGTSHHSFIWNVRSH